MKKFYLIIIISVGLSACNKLDLNPLSEASTGNFYSNQTELELAVNDLYRLVFWGNDNELFGDNEWHRGQLTNAVIGGTMNADDAAVQTYWLNCYKAIARANSFLANKDKAAANTPAAVMLRLEAEECASGESFLTCYSQRPNRNFRFCSRDRILCRRLI